MYKSILFAGIMLISMISVHAQLSTPPSGGNQKSYVKQYIGAVAYVSVLYNSPDVTSPTGEDRTGKIWGQLVPYGFAPNTFGSAEEIPWRAGANENTIIKFSHDVLVQGKAVSAGKYGVHLIPRESGPWTLILSNNSSSWGSYFYDENEDALRADVHPKKGEFTEWLSYEFVDRQEEETTLELQWENLRIPIRIELVGGPELYIAKMKEELRGSTGFQWSNFNAAAVYCLQNNVALDQGLEWADAAINEPFIGQKNFTTLSTKAGVLRAMGRMDESIELMREAVEHPSAQAFQIHGFARNLISMDMKEEALSMFEYNYEKFDGTWPTNVGMTRGLSALGRYEEALNYAKKALELAPDEANRQNLMLMIEKLQEGKDVN